MIHSSLRFLRQLAVLFHGNNLLFWRLFLSGERGWARNLAATQLRQFLALRNRQPIPSRSIFDVFPEASNVAVQLEHKPGETISCSIEELYYIAAITRSIEPRRIFEFGTFRGRTTLNLALNSADEAVIYTLDLPPEGVERAEQERDLLPSDRTTFQTRANEAGRHFQQHPAGHKIVQLSGNSLQFDFAQYWGKMDLIFVDAAHAYRFVKSDSENAFQMLAPGGVILWHDYMSFGEMHDVTRCLFEFAGERAICQLGATTLAVYRDPRRHTMATEVEQMWESGESVDHAIEQRELVSVRD